MFGESVAVPVETLYFFLICVLYLTAGLICLRWLIPHLSATARRLAILMFAAQVLALLLAAVFASSPVSGAWLWKIDQSRGIPSTLSSAQLALVGVAALATGWLSRSRPPWQRVYLLALGVLFPYLGLDDYFDWKDQAQGWIKEPYILIGAAVALATITAALNAPRRARKWHICTLAGLFWLGMGGFVLDGFKESCGQLGALRFDGCFNFIFLEETLEFLGAWLALVGVLGQFSDAAPTPRPRIRALLYLLPMFWFSLLLLTSLPASLEAQQRLDGTQVALGELNETDAAAALPEGEQARQLDFRVSRLQTRLRISFPDLCAGWIDQLLEADARLVSVRISPGEHVAGGADYRGRHRAGAPAYNGFCRLAMGSGSGMEYPQHTCISAIGAGRRCCAAGGMACPDAAGVESSLSMRDRLGFPLSRLGRVFHLS